MNSHAVTFEFHVSRQARDRFQFDDTLFTLTGNVIFANFHAARIFAQKMNDKRDLLHFPEQAVKPGQINAMGLIDEILHYVVGVYREQVSRDVVGRALGWIEERVGREETDRALRRFADSFPTVAVYRRQLDLDAYLQGQSESVPNRQIVLEELLLLWLANMNPAFAPYIELFDDSDLRRDTTYLRLIRELRAFFEAQPRYGPEHQNLVDMLRSPAIASPHSLEGQLTYILERWGYLLGEEFRRRFLYRLLSSLDVIKEERKLVFLGPGPAQVYEFTGLEGEPEAFSPELGWMPSLVLMAKNTYVWMDQLSRQYGRSIARLDEIPEEELDRLARWGFTGLWLIGVWERSPASQRIKQLTGNPEAVPSAYSLYDYVIANDLGGPDAYERLKERAWRRGIRMASDMVPNHVGITSKWIYEHPDWFIALDYNPYPWYTYGGPDLSQDPGVGIFIEDHYYDRTDAAVAFKRVDRGTGREQYIYHGNDGTSMPWNDTAQLNYLNPEVREAVIQTILHVARQFPVIRFDAAMTLAKRHFQRLWFPEPGTGGAIPTRAEHGLTRAQLNDVMPKEFWREVVDRVAAEAPDTLLLAEAFWLLEGYFVRTLGMHRVYNSAFMNMLRDEDNAKYRQVMKNTLEFDPEVLRRFVNFMNNPDERTAVDQFGKGDKYFGVCTLMITMPGLPMFGHGQVEGYAEKYGMEYRRAYHDEWPDQGLVERHEREVFPLMHRRPLFAGVEHFLLYDFFSPDGTVNEDVFAYSNRLGDQRALVIYHNRYAQARGWVRTSAAFAQRTGQGDEKVMVQRTLVDGLDLHGGDDWYSIFRDQASGLEYVRSNRQLRDEGLLVELNAYQRHIFVDFRQVQDTPQQRYADLARYLDGCGVPSIDEALREVLVQSVRQPFEELVQASMLRRLLDARPTASGTAPDTLAGGATGKQVGTAAGQDTGTAPVVHLDPALMADVEQRVRRLTEAAQRFTGGSGSAETVVSDTMTYLRALLSIPAGPGEPDGKSGSGASGKTGSRASGNAAGSAGGADTTHLAPRAARQYLDERTERWAGLFGWVLVRALGGVVDPQAPAGHSRTWFDEWLLGRTLQHACSDLGLDEAAAVMAANVTRVLLGHARAFLPTAPRSPRAILETLLRDGDVAGFLAVNRYRDTLWYSKERYEDLVGALEAAAVVTVSAEGRAAGARDLAAVQQIAGRLRAAAEPSGYQVEALLALVSDGTAGQGAASSRVGHAPSTAGDASSQAARSRKR
ncbi:MAG: alpha-amylase [Chloroflexi bacterium]|nr:alpha-amylase [Chloroflexota bacterium]